MPYSINLNNSNSNVKFDIHFDAIKKLLLAARSALNLYECAVSLAQLILLATLIKLYKLLKNSRLIKRS